MGQGVTVSKAVKLSVSVSQVYQAVSVSQSSLSGRQTTSRSVRVGGKKCISCIQLDSGSLTGAFVVMDGDVDVACGDH